MLAISQRFSLTLDGGFIQSYFALMLQCVIHVFYIFLALCLCVYMLPLCVCVDHRPSAHRPSHPQHHHHQQPPHHHSHHPRDSRHHTGNVLPAWLLVELVHSTLTSLSLWVFLWTVFVRLTDLELFWEFINFIYYY